MTRAVIDYGAAKAGLLNVVKALSQELGPKGILKPEAIRSRLGSG